jgi:hypothetical protein
MHFLIRVSHLESTILWLKCGDTMIVLLGVLSLDFCELEEGTVRLITRPVDLSLVRDWLLISFWLRLWDLSGRRLAETVAVG